jgi:uroporphyrinogen decarboxylase
MLEGEPDRVPVFELIVNQPVKEAFLGRTIASFADEIDFWLQAGYDYASICPGYYLLVPGYEPREGWRRSQVHADYGTGEREMTWGTEDAGIITTWDDFERYPWPGPETIDWSLFEYCMKPAHLPPGMKVVTRAGDIFTWVWQLMGMTTFSFALVENPDLVAAMFQRIGEFIHAVFVRELELDTHGVICGLFYSDDIAFNSGTFCRPAVFRDHLFPWMRRIGDLARQIDVPYIYHSDGDLWQVMGDLAACGVNALQPIEPKSLDAEEVKRREGHRFCLCGNIEVDRLSRGTTAEIEALVRDRIDKLAPGGGYCVGSSNTVPDYVPLANYVAMQNAAFEHGRY